MAVRLEGGVGDHILGMRLLKFIRAKFPTSEIVAYSDAGGHPAPVEVTAMSPLVSRVVPIYREETPRPDLPTTSLELIRSADLQMINESDLVFDAHGDLLYVEALESLQIPLFEILAIPPALTIHADAVTRAEKLLRRYNGAPFVALNLTKLEHPNGGVRHHDLITYICRRLLAMDAVILNIFTSAYDYPHWREPIRTNRRKASAADAKLGWALCTLSDRIVPCVDMPVAVVAALLQRCSYFLGVDNGIKHLAWALGVPRTFLFPGRPTARHVVRWMPDVHRILRIDGRTQPIEQHLAEAGRYLSHGRESGVRRE